MIPTDDYILIAVPTTGSVHYKTAAALTCLASEDRTAVIFGCARPHDHARNQLVRVFLANPELTHLLFIDSDVEPPLNIVERLLALDAPVASGCVRILNPEGPVWTLANRDADGKYNLLSDLPTQTTDVDACGGGCLMIRRDVLEAMSPPWFLWVERPDGSQLGEDIYFCQQLIAAGLRVRVNPALKCIHHKTIPI
jgi:GT2 family glycosyltransferase